MTYLATKKRGFTLVETLVYAIGLFIVLGGLVVFMFYLYRWYRSATIPTRADRAALALMSQVSTDLRASNTLNDSMSQYGTTTGWITMTTSGGSVSTTTTYYLENGRVRSKIGQAATTTISSGDVWVSSFKLTKLVTSNSSAVRIDLGIDYPLNGSTSTNSYSDLAILRQSY